jgi:hypothetical protein
MGMNSKQYVEGKIGWCKNCPKEKSCCDDDLVEEWVNEYFIFHERMKEYLIKLGIKIEFKGDRVFFKGCSDGAQCKFLKYSLNKDIDPRPIDCKIYPFTIDWKSINFDKKIVKVYYWDRDCPLVKNNIIAESFKIEVENILKRDLSLLFYGAIFKIEFVDEVLVD